MSWEAIAGFTQAFVGLLQFIITVVIAVFGYRLNNSWKALEEQRKKAEMRRREEFVDQKRFELASKALHLAFYLNENLKHALQSSSYHDSEGSTVRKRLKIEQFANVMSLGVMDQLQKAYTPIERLKGQDDNWIEATAISVQFKIFYGAEGYKLWSDFIDIKESLELKFRMEYEVIANGMTPQTFDSEETLREKTKASYDLISNFCRPYIEKEFHSVAKF